MQIQKRQLIDIDGTELTRILYKNIPVVTFQMINKVHKRPENTAEKNFYRNKNHFQEGKHFFEVPFEEWKQLQTGNHSMVPSLRENQKLSLRGGHRGYIILLTERGYLLLVKTFRDDKSWEIQDKLVEKYFQPQIGLTLTKEDILTIKENMREDFKKTIRQEIRQSIREEAKKILPVSVNVRSSSSRYTDTIEDWPQHGGKILKWQVRRDSFGNVVHAKVRWDLMN